MKRSLVVMKLPLHWLWIAMASANLMAEESPGRAPVEPDRLPAPDQEVAEVTPAIEKLEDGQMKIGQVTFDPKSRRIRFPAAINQTEGLLEFLYNGRFVAESTGDLAAIFLSNTALINFSGKDNELDEVWLPHPTRVPPEGTPVTVIIEPNKS